MLTAMTPRARLVFLAVAAMTAVAGLLVVDGVVFNDAPAASSSLVSVTDGPDAPVATPAKSHPVLAVIRGLPLASAVAVAVASVMARGSRPLVRGLQLRLGDVSDGWRALLLGAPPAFL